MNDALALFASSLQKSYGSVRALRGVDLEVKYREIFGFLGPNGAGKTTAIRCMLDLIRPESGVLRVLGLDPQKDPVRVRSLTGYLPGELRFEENMTVIATLRYLAQLRKNKVDWQHVNSMVERLNLNPKLAIKNLSKGNKQKVGIIQAMMHQPDLLLLDEPTVGLDPLMQQEVLKLIQEARQRGATAFFSSHILSEVQAISDRVGIIRSGIVIEVAETASLMRRTLRKVSVRFRQVVDIQTLLTLPGIQLIEGDREANNIVLQVEGEIDFLIKALAAYPVVDFETERPSLEEIFLAYYETKTPS